MGLKEFRVVANETREVTREPENDGWDCGDEEISVSFEKALVVAVESKEGGFNHHLVATQRYENGVENSEEFWNYNGDTVHLVVARFGTGSTFGHTSGNWAVEGIFKTYKAAQKFEKRSQKRFQEKHHDYFGGFENSQIETLRFENKTLVPKEF